MANDLEFVLFFTFLIVFVVTISGYAEVSILQAQGFDIGQPDQILDPVSSFFTFFALMFVESPVQAISGSIFVFLILPYTFGMLYLALKWLRGTG